MRDLADSLLAVSAAAERLRAFDDEHARQRREERARLVAALRAARAAGGSLSQLGDAAGLSRQRIAQLLGGD